MQFGTRSSGLHMGRGMALLLVVVLASCQGTLSSTPLPTSSDATELPISTQLVTSGPDPTASPAPTSSEPSSTSTEPQPTPTEPSPTLATGPPGSRVWRHPAALPSGLTITGLGYTYEFIVAGHVAAPRDGCAERTRAHVWTSDFGSDWFDVFTGAQVFGTVDVVIDPYRGSAVGSWSVDCEASPAVWLPTDKSDWYQGEAVGLSSADQLVDGVGLLDSFSIVVTGWAADDPDHMGVWTARHLEGIFTRASSPPESRYGNTLSALTAMGETVVGFDGTGSVPAWYSLDAGDTWQNTGFQPPFWFHTTDADVTPDQVVATGFACCTFLGERVGVVVRSPDGIHWDTDGAPLLPTIPEAIVGTETQLVALGKQVYVSRDGSDWRVAAPLPGYERGDPMFAATGEGLLMVASPSQIWLASLADLDPDRWPEPPAEVDVPRVGESYAGSLLTHCGVNGALMYGLRMWVPDDASLVEGDYPPSFGDLERGEFVLTTDDRLEFTSQRGVVLVYHPTVDPPESFPCA